MSVESSIFQVLKTWPALAGVIIRPDKAEQGDAAPYIIYQKVTGQRVKSLAGDSGLANPLFQFDVYAASRMTAATLRDEMRKALQAATLLGAVHAGEGAGYEAETKLCRERVDFSLWFYD